MRKSRIYARWKVETDDQLHVVTIERAPLTGLAVATARCVDGLPDELMHYEFRCRWDAAWSHASVVLSEYRAAGCNVVESFDLE